MSRRFGLLAVSLTLAVSACVTPAPGGEEYVYPQAYWRLRPVELFPAGHSQTAQVGQFLFTQQFATAGTATISAPVENVTANHLNYQPGARFLQMAFAGPATYCDRTVSRGNVWLGPMRACFLDRDADGVFDRSYMGRAMQNDSFVPTYLSAGAEIHVPYVKGPSNSERLLSAGVVVTQSVLGAFRLEFAATDNHGPIILSSAEAPTPSSPDGAQDVSALGLHFRAEDLPLTLHMGGAEIKIDSIVNDVVTYTVNATFDSRETMAIAYSWDLPTDD